MHKNIRIQDLLERRKKALQHLSRAKEALGAGSWHEDSSYELADSEIRVYTALLDDIEKELKELEE